MIEQEVLPADGIATSRAADGGIVQSGAAMTGGQFLDMIEDGEMSRELHMEMKDLAAVMQDIGNATGTKTKGKLVITIDLTREDNAFRIASSFKVTKPELPKARSIMWVDENNRFTRFPPGQSQLFGARSVGGSGGIRSI